MCNGPLFGPYDSQVFSPIEGPIDITPSKISPATLRQNKVAEPSAVFRESSGSSVFLHAKTSSQELSDTDSYSDIIGDSRIGALLGKSAQKAQTESADPDFRHSPTSAFRQINKLTGQSESPRTPNSDDVRKTPGSISSLHNLTKNDETRNSQHRLSRSGGTAPEARSVIGSDSTNPRESVTSASEEDEVHAGLRAARSSYKKRGSSGGLFTEDAPELSRRYPRTPEQAKRPTRLDAPARDEHSGHSDGEAPLTQTQPNIHHLEQFHAQLHQRRRVSGQNTRKTSQPETTPTTPIKRDSLPSLKSIPFINRRKSQPAMTSTPKTDSMSTVTSEVPKSTEKQSEGGLGKKLIQPVKEAFLSTRNPSVDSNSSQSSRTSGLELSSSGSARKSSDNELDHVITARKPTVPEKPAGLTANHVKPVRNHVTSNHVITNHVTANHVSSNHRPHLGNHVQHNSDHVGNHVTSHVSKPAEGVVLNGPVKEKVDSLQSNHVTASTVLGKTSSSSETDEGMEMRDLKIRRRLHRDHIANLASLQSSSC